MRRFRQILADVATYYTKKLDMLRIKMEHHQNVKPNPHHVQLAKDLMEVYQGQTNWDQLWKDMFCRCILRPNWLWYPNNSVDPLGQEGRYCFAGFWVAHPTRQTWQGRSKIG